MKSLLIVLICSITWSYSHGFDCYECQNCQIPFNNQTNTATCASGITQCMKVTAKLGTVYNYVVKQCGPCSNETFAFGVTYLRVDCCTGPTCNGSASLTLPIFSLFIMLILCLVYHRK